LRLNRKIVLIVQRTGFSIFINGPERDTKDAVQKPTQRELGEHMKPRTRPLASDPGKD
jgi:hypothetical protein